MSAPALAALSARGAGHAVSAIASIHGAVARRAAPVALARAPHDAIAALVYRWVRLGLQAAAGALALAAGPRASHPAVAGALSGAWGDRLEAEGSPLAVHMTAVDVAGPRTAVLLHGLCESDAAWGEGILAALHETGWTPVRVRYNSGLPIPENGRRLAGLLEALVADEDVDELLLVGHSMGALVLRSAATVARADHDRWPGLVRTTVSLGAPHHGAPLEVAAEIARRVLAVLPETRPLAELLAARSEGIKDLRFGAVVDADRADPDALFRDPCSPVPLMPGPRHLCLTASLHPDPRHPLSRALGDLLVLEASGSGRARAARRVEYAEGDVRHVGGLSHFGLLSDPRVADLVREWAAPPVGSLSAA